ncbi:MAG: hypothetical protein K2N03_05460, partial [Muribaculaceae bacterium]|nr:hypothetical protein [Muribaculaceae bacterium]
KINSTQFYRFWRNLSMGLLLLVAVIAFSKLLPYYLSPIVAILATAVLYTALYNNRFKEEFSCALIPYSLFYSLIVYSFVSIIVNVLWMWNIIIPSEFPREMIFFNYPFIPSMYICPCCFFTMLVMYLRRNKLSLCVDCKINKQEMLEHGKAAAIFSYESHFQLKNLTIIFGVLTAIVWGYYYLIYNHIAPNDRDWYIFTWFVIIFFILDEFYFIFRYYNLYLDLKENNEIISSEELEEMSTKTYLRYYVCCGNKIFVDTKAVDTAEPFIEHIDTPFYSHRSLSGISVDEVRTVIERMTGIKGGELRFFFGRKANNLNKHNILRYFYFLDEENGEAPEIDIDGEWMDFNKIKTIYSRNPKKLTHIFRTDISRLATILLTEKLFDERGFRKNKIKSYTPSFSLKDVRDSELDFQDDKWIKISMFNSDTPFYRLKRWWRSLKGVNSNDPSWNKK